MCTKMTGLRRVEKSSSSGVIVVLIPWEDVMTGMVGTERHSGCGVESTWAWIKVKGKLRYLGTLIMFCCKLSGCYNVSCIQSSGRGRIG